MDFLALDVETANPNLASICQVGLVEFANGELVKSSVWVVDPEDYFAGIVRRPRYPGGERQGPAHLAAYPARASPTTSVPNRGQPHRIRSHIAPPRIPEVPARARSMQLAGFGGVGNIIARTVSRLSSASRLRERASCSARPVVGGFAFCGNLGRVAPAASRGSLERKSTAPNKPLSRRSVRRRGTSLGAHVPPFEAAKLQSPPRFSGPVCQAGFT